ncbi:MAG: leucine-rich repeat domain-containing protein [Chloroflexi bacterium]|nr:leucine-rich repeat domain-containing protein [Chloroflexota bacterium]
MTAWLPRKLIIIVIVVWLVTYAAMMGYASPKHDPDFAAMVRLLEWRDPVTGQKLPLPIDRNQSFDEQIKDLRQLEVLYFAGTVLSELPPEIGFLVGLRELDLSYHNLTTLPPQIGNLTSLEILNLYENRLTELPPEIGNLTALENLHLSNNQLVQICPEIGNLTNLDQLYLDTNNLREIPPEIGNLTSLEMLTLAGNQIIELPPDVEQLCAKIFCTQ